MPQCRLTLPLGPGLQVTFDPFVGFHLLHNPILLLPIFEDAVVSVQFKILAHAESAAAQQQQQQQLNEEEVRNVWHS